MNNNSDKARQENRPLYKMKALMVHLRCGNKYVQLHSLQLTTATCWLLMVHTQLLRNLGRLCCW